MYTLQSFKVILDKIILEKVIQSIYDNSINTDFVYLSCLFFYLV